MVECIISDCGDFGGHFIRRALVAERIIKQSRTRFIRKNAVFCHRKGFAPLFHRKRLHVGERPQSLRPDFRYGSGNGKRRKFPAIGESPHAEALFVSAESYICQFAQIIASIIADGEISGRENNFFDRVGSRKQSVVFAVDRSRYQLAAVRCREIKFRQRLSEITVHNGKQITVSAFFKGKHLVGIGRYHISCRDGAIARDRRQRLRPAVEFGNGRDRRLRFRRVFALFHRLRGEYLAVPVREVHRIYGDFPYSRQDDVFITDRKIFFGGKAVVSVAPIQEFIRGVAFRQRQKHRFSGNFRELRFPRQRTAVRIERQRIFALEQRFESNVRFQSDRVAAFVIFFAVRPADKFVAGLAEPFAARKNDGTCRAHRGGRFALRPGDIESGSVNRLPDSLECNVHARHRIFSPGRVFPVAVRPCIEAEFVFGKSAFRRQYDLFARFCGIFFAVRRTGSALQIISDGVNLAPRSVNV